MGESGGEEEWGKVGYWAVNYSSTGARSPGMLLSSRVTAGGNYVVFISEGYGKGVPVFHSKERIRVGGER